MHDMGVRSASLAQPNSLIQCIRTCGAWGNPTVQKPPQGLRAWPSLQGVRIHLEWTSCLQMYTLHIHLTALGLRVTWRSPRFAGS